MVVRVRAGEQVVGQAQLLEKIEKTGMKALIDLSSRDVLQHPRGR